MLHKILFTLVFSLIFGSSLPALDKPYVALKCRSGGMFSIFNDVLRLVDMYDKGVYSGVAVKFDQAGFYYDIDKGDNWWNYYCEPIGLGHRFRRPIVETDGLGLPYAPSREDLRNFNRDDAARLVAKYIHPKQPIWDKVKEFSKKNFQDKYVIGVHYRGTDKVLEAPRVSYEEMAKKVKEIVMQKQTADYVVFVATDEQPFLEYMLKEHPHNVAYWDCVRSDTHKPVHKYPQVAPYRLGEDAIMDCLLLSKADKLVRTASNLSLWSGYFNPKMKVIEMSKNYRP